MRCDAGTNIVIVKADFGRDKYSSVCGEYYYDGNCTSIIETTGIMRNLCSYKDSCDVLANGATFPDSCYGEQKILKVWYQCVGTGNLNLKEVFRNFYAFILCKSNYIWWKCKWKTLSISF